MVVFGRSTSNQDLLCGRANVVFEHRVFVCLFEQVVHYCGWFFSERFKERCIGTYASFKDL